jgi:hypothetical protein
LWVRVRSKAGGLTRLRIKPPSFPLHPFGTIAIDNEGKEWEMQLISLTDPRLVWPEGSPDKPRPTREGRLVVRKYVNWIVLQSSMPPPLYIHEKEDGKLHIHNGHHRARAVWLARLRFMNAWVRKLPTQQQ